MYLTNPPPPSPLLCLQYAHKLGSGTYKKVYLGIDTLDGKDVAWSTVRKHVPKYHSHWTRVPLHKGSHAPLGINSFTPPP